MLVYARRFFPVAAFFGEPVMGAGGVFVPPAGYWPKIQAVLRKYDVLLVADEVMAGHINADCKSTFTGLDDVRCCRACTQRAFPLMPWPMLGP